jgi:hypothetical protein
MDYIENDGSNNSPTVACVFDAVETSFFTDRLPSDKKKIHIRTHRLIGGIFMKNAVEMGSGVMIHLPSFIKTGLGIQKLIRGIHRQHGELMSLIFSSK